jgi:uncharacterized membrane protein
MKKSHENLKKEYINKLVNEENEHIRHLNQIVIESLNEKELLASQVLYEPKDEKVTFGTQISDTIAKFGGSWYFIILFATIVIGWMIFNKVLGLKAFDPFPYILLNLVLSCLAAFQAPVILMSQNRQSAKEKQRSKNEYLINLKAELQTRELNSKIDILTKEQMKILIDTQKTQLETLNNLEKILNKIYKSNPK